MKKQCGWQVMKCARGVLLLALLVPLGVIGSEPAGIALAKLYKEQDIGWGSSVANMKIIIRDQQGGERTRHMRTFYYELADDGDKSIVVIDSPSDVKGTAFLNYSHINTADDQWLFLPEVKRVKRVSSHNKSGSFMGSEFSYEDFGSFELGKYSFVRQADETIEGVDCYVLDSVPLYEYSGYTKIRQWIDKLHVRLVKTEYYDRKGALLKTLHSRNFKRYKGKYWRALNSVMVNHRNGMSTELLVSSYEFDVGLNEKFFTKNNLKRIR